MKAGEYTAAIAALGTQQWRRAFVLLEAMRARGIEAPTSTLTAAVHVAGRAGAWVSALQLGGDVSAAAALASCSAAAAWRPALRLLGLGATESGRNACVTACERAGQWAAA